MNRYNSNNSSRLYRNNEGLAAIEFAFIAPILIILLTAIIDFGLYYLRAQTINRAVANISSALALNPLDESIAQLRQQGGLGFANLEGADNYLCAMSYHTQAEAEQSGCEGNATWYTAPPTPDLTEYYVAINARVSEASLTGLFSDILPVIKVKNIIKVRTTGGASCTAHDVYTQMVDSSNAGGGFGSAVDWWTQASPPPRELAYSEVLMPKWSSTEYHEAWALQCLGGTVSLLSYEQRYTPAPIDSP